MTKIIQILSAAIILVLSSSCSATISNDAPSDAVLPVTPTIDEEWAHDPTSTMQPSSLAASATPAMAETAFMQTETAERSAEQTLVAPFPNICEQTPYPWELSTNGLWLARLCDSREDESLIFTLANRETQTLWKLIYKDYTQRSGILFDEGFEVVNWSNDNRYAYLSLFFRGDGGECFTGTHEKENGKALIRLDLQTGRTNTILPQRADFGGYGFSFAPTGRRFVYEKFPHGLKIQDLQSGQLVDVIPASPFDVGGDYVWSPDGLQFVYSTVFNNMEENMITYSLRLVDGKTGSEQILVESTQNCFAAKYWEDDHTLIFDSFDQDYKADVIRYDIGTRQILSEGTATPPP